MQHTLARNNVHISGAPGQTIVFAHGFGCSQTMWRFVAPAFAATHQIVLFDYVGAGRSDRRAYSPQRYATLKGYAQDVLDICEALDLRRVIFVAHSISGMIGVLAAIQAPARFERLILIGSSACYINDPPEYTGGWSRDDIHGLLDLMEKNYGGWASFLAPLVMKNAARPELARELEESFLATDPTIANDFARATFFTDNRRDLPAVTVPSLILQPADDIIVPLSAADYLHRHLPHSTLRHMQAIGHYPHVSHPAELIQLIREDLDQPANRGSSPH